MISKDLRIQIVAELNKALSTSELQKQLKSIQSELKINIGIGSENIGNIQKQISELQKKINGQGFKIIDDKEAIENINKGKKGIRELYTDIDRAVKRYSELGQVKVDKVFHPVTKELQGFNLQIERASGLVDKLKLDMVKIGDIKGSDAFEVVSRKQVDDTQKILEQQLQQQTRIEQQLTKNKESEKQRTLELQKQLDLYKQQAQLNAQNITRTHSGHVDKDRLDDYLKSVNELTVKTPDLDHKMKQLGMSFRQISGDAKESAGALQQSGLTLTEALRTAMVKFPIWMVASTAFFGTIRLFKEMTSVIREVDDGLVALKKVMDEDTNFDKVMQTAINSSEKFARTLSEALDAMEEFAKQGYTELDLTFLTEAGLVAANVAELSTQQASEYLTSTLIQWKKETSEAMSIIDSWNNISNNFATTSERIAQGHARAASTARVMGLSFHELNAVIGSVTASTKQSGSEIGNFIKNVLPRLTSKPAQDALDMVNVSMFDDVGNMRHVIDIYQDVADKLKTMDKYNQSIVLEGLAGKFHISRMSAFLSDLGSADSLYREMLEASIDSQGSALRENETYMESITARAKLARVEFEKMALSMGDQFLTETMIQTYKGMGLLLESIGSITNSLGGLPVILGVAGMAFGLFSKNAQQANITIKTTDFLMNKLNITSKTLSITLKGLIASTGVGLAFVGVSFALEALLSTLGKARQAQEDLERSQREIVDSYKQGKESIEELSQSYAKYEKIIASGDYKLEDLNEFNRIRNEIAEIMPNMIIGENAYGNKIIKSSDQISRQVNLLERQLEVQERLDQLKRKEEVKEEYSTAQDSVREVQDQIKQLEKESGHSFESAKQRLEELHNKQIELASQGKELSSWDAYNLNAVKNTIDKYMLLEATLNNANIAFQNTSSSFIKLNLEMDSNISKTTESIIDNFTTLVSLSGTSEKSISNVFENFKNSIDKGEFNKLFKDLETSIDTYNRKISEGLRGERLDAFAKDVESASRNINQSLLNLANNNGITGKELESISNSLEAFIKNALVSSIDFDKVSESTGKTVEELRLELGLLGEEFDNLSDIVDGSIDSMESLLKSYEETSSEISVLNELLEKMAQGKSITAHEAMELISKEKELANAISIESGQIKINEDAVRKLRDTKISSYKSMIESAKNEAIVTAQSIQTNMSNYGKEIKSIKDLASAKAALAKIDLQLNTQFDETGGYVDKKLLADWKQMQDIIDTIEQLDKLAELASSGLSSVGTEAEKASKSNKKNSESLKESTYYTDEYKNAVAKLNLELDKLNQIKAKFSPHSKEYRKALEDEIKLTKQMMNLHKQQQSSLQSQISSGKFTPTGMVTKEVGTSSGKSSLSGWSGTISSGFGRRNAPTKGASTNHQGIDLRVAQGTSLQSNVSGTVKSASFTSGGAGGLIEITDEQGRVHRYMHMSNINVKAGQNVNVGDIIGNTGGTKGTKGAGTSTGAHLHYEVRVNGQAINPIDFINQAKGMQVSTKNIGQAQADLAQSTDQARNEIISIDQELIKLQETIDNLEIELINSRLSEFQFLREGADRNIQRSQQILEDYSMSSKMYRDELEKQNKQKRYQIDLYTKEAEYLRKQLEREDLSAKVKDELTVKLSEVVLAYHEYNAVIKENTKLIEDSLRLEQFTNKMEDLDYELQVSRGLMQLVNDESEEYTDHLIKQDKLLRQKLDLNSEEIERLSELLTTYRKGTKQYEETKKLIRELTLESIGYNNELQNLLETTKKVAQEKLNKITDVERKVIEMIKHRINEEKKALQDNLKDYQDYWNEKIRILRKAHEEEDWDKALQKEQEALSNLRALYNKQMLDDSLESRNKQRQLLKQIQEQEEKIQDMLRKKALDKEIEGIEQLVKEEQDRTEEKLSELDKQLENDKLYIEARKAIESGYLKWYTVETKNVQGLVRREFITTTKTLEDAYVEFEDRFGEGMSILGKKIKSEFIASIKLAQQEIINLAKLIQETGININFDPYGLDIIGKDNVDGRPSGNLSNDNLNLMWAKFLNDKVMQDSKVRSSAGSMKSFGKMKDTVVGFISDRSSTIDPNNLLNFDQAFATLEQDQKDQLLSFLRQKLLTEGRVEDKTNISVVDSLLKHVARFNTGGGTGKWSGNHPKLAAVDSEELILRKKDNHNFEGLMNKLEFANNNILPNIKSAIPSTLNMIKQANPLQGIDLRFDNLIHVEGNIDSVTMPKVESAINSAFEKLNRTFNMNGVFRKI